MEKAGQSRRSPESSAAGRKVVALGRQGDQLTLPDLLREELDIVFVGINPSVFSARQGHYFARPSNRFWPCFSRSALSRAAREALGVARLRPEHDCALLHHGFGFTDVVKRATVRAADVAPGEFASEIATLATKLERYQPRIACFHGITGYRRFHQAIVPAGPDPELGPQSLRLGDTRLFVLPNPSGANAHVTPAEQTRWYDRLACCLVDLGERG